VDHTRIYGAVLAVLGVGLFIVDWKWPSKRQLFSNRTAMTPALILAGAWLAAIPVTEERWTWMGAVIAGIAGLVLGVILAWRRA
jgi:hypothetical protein